MTNIIRRASWLGAIALLSISLTACGNNDDNNKKSTNNTTTDMGADMNMTTDMGGTDMGGTDMGGTDMGGTDMGGTDMGMMGPMADVQEVEPNNEYEEATSFNAGQSIGGFVDRSTGDAFDADRYKVTLEAGTIFEWKVANLGAGIGANGLFVDVEDESGDVYSTLVSAEGTTRQTFIPTAGTYTISVYDARLAEDPVPTHGGATATYVIETSVKAAAPTDAAVPSATDGDQNDGAVDVYKVAAGEDMQLAAEILAGRDPVGSDLDPKVYIWDVAAKAVVAFNDDIDGENENYDSFASGALENGKEYWVIVDAYANAANAAYKLYLDKEDDGLANPGALTVGGTAQGNIAEPVRGRPDTDYFTIELQPGQHVLVTAKADAANTVQPALYAAVETADGPEGLYGSGTVKDASALTLSHPANAGAPGKYIVLVDDARNIAETPTLSGGATFNYTLTAAAVTPAAKSIAAGTSSDSLAMGSYAWYTLPVTAGQIVKLTGSSTAANAAVTFVQFSDDAQPSTIGADVTYFASAAGDFNFAARDEMWIGTYADVMYPLEVKVTTADTTGFTYTDVNESGTNSSLANAQELTPPVSVLGTNASMDSANPDVDFFKVTLNAGDTLVVYTEADPNAPDADPNDPSAGKANLDTIVTIHDAAGAALVSNDDFLGTDEPGFSAAFYTATTAGDYVISVAPFAFDAFGFVSTGNYIMKVGIKSGI